MKAEEFVESAYEARKAEIAEEAVKEVARKQEQAEREAIQLKELREFVALQVPEALLDYVDWPGGRWLFQNLQLVVRVPGCVPVSIYIYGQKGEKFYTREGWLVPALCIRRPAWDKEEGEVFRGVADVSWGQEFVPYNLYYAKDFKTAIGVARERWLRLAEAEAENKRLYDELTIQHRAELEKRGGEAEYVPVVDDVSPAVVFSQALREYVYNLVDEKIHGMQQS